MSSLTKFNHLTRLGKAINTMALCAGRIAAMPRTDEMSAAQLREAAGLLRRSSVASSQAAVFADLAADETKD